MPPVSDMEVAPVPEGEGRGGLLSRDDCLCPVCLEIFLEPVTLPCDHTFCKACFLESVDKATLCCPLCRRRVSTWARLNGRNKTLVNDRLWRQIQTAFPLQCQRRLSGQDGDEEGEEVLVSRPRVSQPGELRREYEDQISKLAEEKRALEEAERKASEEYIQRLLAEEEERLAEERRRQEEKQLEDDERLARLLSHELNSSSPVSQDNVRSPEVTPAKRKQKASGGHIEKFLCPHPPKTSPSDSSPTSSFMANKENILHSRSSSMESVERPMPKMDYYGRQTDCYDRQTDCYDRQTDGYDRQTDGYDRQTDGSRSPPESPTVHPSSAPTDKLDRYCSSFLNGEAGPSSAKRKSSELETAVAKRGCSSLPSTSSSSSVQEDGSTAGQVQLLQEITEWEAELSSRQRQEEEDRRLALLLQKELHREDMLRATNRSKGSTDAYPLRQKHQAKVETSTGLEQATPTKPAKSLPSSSVKKTPKTSSPSSSFSSVKKTPKTSSPSSSFSSVKKTPKTSIPSTPSSSSSPANPLCRGSKQATLTEMFPSLGS